LATADAIAAEFSTPHPHSRRGRQGEVHTGRVVLGLEALDCGARGIDALTFRELLDDRLGIAGEGDEAQGVRRTDLVENV
jgi:hypothetical protein